MGRNRKEFLMKRILLALSLIGTLSTAWAQSNVTALEAELIHGQNSNFRNYVKNPTCRRNVSDITASSVAAVKNTSSALDGISDCTWNPTASTQTLKWQVKTWAKGLKGRNCEARILYSGDASLVKAYINQNSSKITSDLTLINSGTNSSVGSINFPCGDASVATEVVLESTGDAANVSYAVYTGEATNIGTVAQAKYLGSLTYAGTASCAWSAASASFVNFAADTDCPAPTVTGSITATGTKIPGFVVPGFGSGTLRVVAKGTFFNNGSGQLCYWRFSDGTNATTSQVVGGSSTSTYVGSLEGSFSYSSPQSSLTVQIQVGQASAGTCIVDASTTTLSNLSFDVYHVPDQSQQAIRMDQSNYDWTAYTPTISGFGSTTSAVFYHRRVGSNLQVKGSFVTGSVAGTTASVTLPGSLILDTNKIPLNTTTANPAFAVGQYNFSDQSNAVGSMVVATSTSTSLVYFAEIYASASNLRASTGSGVSGNTDQGSIFFEVPISGWTENQNAPLLAGGVTSSATGMERIERVQFSGGTFWTDNCSSSPCTMNSNTPGITAVTRAAAGRYDVTFAAGIFSIVPTCTCISLGRAVHHTSCGMDDDAAPTVTNLSLRIESTDDGASAATDASVQVICVGPR